MALAHPIGAVGEGAPEPLGVTLTPTGVNVAVWSAHAEAVEFCLFDDRGETETARVLLQGRTGPVFHAHIPGLRDGARYGFRAHGAFAPAQGRRFNPNKLLIDPYALSLDRTVALHPAMFGYRLDDPQDGASFDDADSAAVMPKAVVVAPIEAAAEPLAIPWGEMVIYELHVRGFTRNHPDIPEALRGTFAGLAHPAALAYLKGLGVTTVELMPAAAWTDERHLPPRGLSNYWGYNPVALLAPDPRLAPGGWAEVRAATSALAAVGIETILDVVLNHTGEGDAMGPTLSLRGLDDDAYYRRAPQDPGRYLNEAGTGNTLALNGGPALRLAMDALRAWRRLGGMAGFRFDLATILGRGVKGFDPAAPLLAAIDQDPDLRGLKLIAEPWDMGPGGYQLGRFPPPWGEWNDRFRDTARGFWRGDAVPLGELARRLSGSEDVFATRRPSRSINFIVSHDGFTLADLVAYETKHNEANGEDNRDGTDDNRSWNHGVEGPAADPAVTAARQADQRALLATLLLSRGTPMLSMGAESGRSQGGANNAYAQDDLSSWMDWRHLDADLLAFTKRLVTVRRDHPALRADRFLTGTPPSGGVYSDVEWRAADGSEMMAGDWDDPAGETLVMALAEPEGKGLDRAIIAIHRGRAPADIALPEPRDGYAWTLLADSADPARPGEVGEGGVSARPRSVLLLAETRAPGRRPRGVADDVLGRLAWAAGIAPDWSSLDGESHAVSPATQTALLAALKLPAATTNQALESLRALADEQDRRALPFALAARVDEAITVRLMRGDGAPPPRTWLTVQGEDGQVLRVRAAPGAGVEDAAHGRDSRLARGLVMALPALSPGVYVVRRDDRPDCSCRLTVAPRHCHVPEALRTGRRWGLSAQLYALRRLGDQGVGDFTTLGALGEIAGTLGAAMVAINPTHALFDDDRERASPYSPSDRRFLDPLYLDLSKVPFAEGFADALQALSGLAAVDYPKVWDLKAHVLEASFAKGGLDPVFAAFIEAGGETLRRFALFQAIAETRPGEPWPQWPLDLRSPDAASVEALAYAHAPRVRHHQYLQWLCEGQLAEAARRSGGLDLGLCRDLAIGAAPDGAEIWAEATLMVAGVSIGAPPDPLGPRGQVWGLPPFDPHRLRADGYQTIRRLFAANMRHAGALRIDHVMGLARLFWIPQGADAAEGAYVSYPLDDLLAVLALESERARCLVIGEDLGTVPGGFRDTLSDARVLSYRVLSFERDEHGFTPPGAYPRQAMACVATHDLPPLAGWWDGVDIAERQRLSLITPAQADDARAMRMDDRHALIQALTREHLEAEPLDPAGPLTPAIAAAIHGFIARSNAALALAQVEDLAGEREAVNLPGTDRERPNWRRRIAAPLEAIFDTPLAKGILDAIRAERTGQPT